MGVQIQAFTPLAKDREGKRGFRTRYQPCEAEETTNKMLGFPISIEESIRVEVEGLKLCLGRRLSY
jgi:hypothetical protein